MTIVALVEAVAKQPKMVKGKLMYGVKANDIWYNFFGTPPVRGDMIQFDPEPQPNPGYNADVHGFKLADGSEPLAVAPQPSQPSPAPALGKRVINEGTLGMIKGNVATNAVHLAAATHSKVKAEDLQDAALLVIELHRYLENDIDLAALLQG